MERRIRLCRRVNRSEALVYEYTDDIYSILDIKKADSSDSILKILLGKLRPVRALENVLKLYEKE